ncbi:MAG: hypothetical protein ACK55I_33410, partial [bacterium]
LHRRLVGLQFFLQHLESHGAMLGVLGAEDGRGPPLAHLPPDRVPGQRRSNKRFNSHEANVMPARKPSKQYHAPPLAPFSQQDGKMGAVRTRRRFFEQLAVACA